MLTHLGSLRDMYEMKAARYHEAVTLLQQAISLVDGCARPPQFQAMTVENINAAVGAMTSFAIAIQPLQVPVTRLAGIELLQQLEDGVGKLQFVQCGTLMLELSKTLRRELETRKVFCLDVDRAPFYAPDEPLWGAEIAKQFPSLVYEIDQAGKCYACDLTTAAAFHAIRCLEAGIRAVSRCLGIPDPTKGADRNWNNISKAIKAAIDARWPASTGRMAGDAQLFDEIHGALAGMQNPYRNATMHLDAKYTAPEALHIFELVKGLMMKIASRMDQDGNPRL